MADIKVVPYIGTWIETLTSIKVDKPNNVVPYIGTWIETLQSAASYPW